MNAKAKVDPLANMLADVEANTLIDNVAKVKAKATFDDLDDTYHSEGQATSRCSGIHTSNRGGQRH